MNARRPHSVVVADDHPIVVAGMRLVFGGSRFFELVGEAATGAEAILRCEQFRPHILLLDLRLPDLPAATICQRIKERQPGISIVILTAYPEEMAVRSCFKAGAVACLFKDSNEQHLLSALLQVVHGRGVIDPRIAGAAIPSRGRASGDGVLTTREREMLRLIARGLTTKEIADEAGLSPNTVKSHTRTLFTKLDAHNRVQALAVAKERALI